MSPVYFQIDTRRLSFRECWWQARSPAVLLLWIFKLIRFRLTAVPRIPLIHSLMDLRILPESVDPHAQGFLAAAQTELTSLGFFDPTYAVFKSSRGEIHSTLLEMRHESGSALGRFMVIENRMVSPRKTIQRYFFLSRLQGGPWLVSAANPPDLHTAPGVEVIRKIPASPAELWALHQSELALRPSTPAQPILDQATGDALANEYELYCQQYQLDRGVYKTEETANEPPAAEVSTSAANSESPNLPLNTEPSPHAPILAELERLQNPKSSLPKVLSWLAGSLMLFVVLGGLRWSWELVAFLVPVLLLHEAGHWLAMKLFGYRNLKMFFIPLFGAAVSGESYNIPGWKKAVVSLAGPLPGILIGFALMVAVVMMEWEAGRKLALMTLALNAFNLLPFLPFDGGWFLNAILFCRRPWLEVAFRALAVLALAGAGIVTGQLIFWFLAALMLMPLRGAWREARLAAQLRAAGWTAVSPDSRSIPPESAIALIDAIQADNPVVLPAPIVAGRTLRLFERLNAQPPGVLGTLLLLLAYFGAIGLALLGLVGGFL
ncbi:MAG: site-2 protease family protein [Verrucomicrobia bacterium]|nr:site-2 protease family protein [Verrucomicrobiota bacterium]